MKLNSVKASEFLVKALPYVGKTRAQWTDWLGNNRRKGAKALYPIPFSCAGKGQLGRRLTRISYDQEDLEKYVQWMLKNKSTSKFKLGHTLPKLVRESMRGKPLIEMARLRMKPAEPRPVVDPVAPALAVEPAHPVAVPAQRFAVSCLLKGGENGKIDQELSVESGSSENEAIGSAVMAALNKSRAGLALIDISCVPVR